MGRETENQVNMYKKPQITQILTDKEIRTDANCPAEIIINKKYHYAKISVCTFHFPLITFHFLVADEEHGGVV
jgi:hypothetical protein